MNRSFRLSLRIHARAAALALAVLPAAALHGQGSLEPDGPPGPTMVSFGEAFAGHPRPLAGQPFGGGTVEIRAPGRYFLRGNIVADSNLGPAIRILTAPAVEIDLNGYAILSANPNGLGAFPAIETGGPIKVHNGFVSGNWTAGVVSTDDAESWTSDPVDTFIELRDLVVSVPGPAADFARGPIRIVDCQIETLRQPSEELTYGARAESLTITDCQMLNASFAPGEPSPVLPSATVMGSTFDLGTMPLGRVVFETGFSTISLSRSTLGGLQFDNGSGIPVVNRSGASLSAGWGAVTITDSVLGLFEAPILATTAPLTAVRSVFYDTPGSGDAAVPGARPVTEPILDPRVEARVVLDEVVSDRGLYRLGDRAVVRDSLFGNGGLVLGHDGAVRDSHFHNPASASGDGTFVAAGDAALVEDNHFVRPGRAAVDVGPGSVVRGNSIGGQETDAPFEAVIELRGARSRVENNFLTGNPLTGLKVHRGIDPAGLGDEQLILGNRMAFLVNDAVGFPASSILGNVLEIPYATQPGALTQPATINLIHRDGP